MPGTGSARRSPVSSAITPRSRRQPGLSKTTGRPKRWQAPAAGPGPPDPPSPGPSHLIDPSTSLASLASSDRLSPDVEAPSWRFALVGIARVSFPQGEAGLFQLLGEFGHRDERCAHPDAVTQ